jgi:hypothetical protein
MDAQAVAGRGIPGAEARGTGLDAAQAESGIPDGWVGAVVVRDFPALGQLFAPDVAFRALVPKGLREASDVAGAIAWVERWFGDADAFEVLSSSRGRVLERLAFAYRLRVHKPDGWRVIEQQVYATVSDGRITKFDLLCSGFLPVPDASGVESGSDAHTPAAAPVTATVTATGAATATAAGTMATGSVLEALGADCATLIPQLARSVAALPPATVLDLHTDDPTAGPSLAAWARLTGNVVVGSSPDPVAGSHWFVHRKELTCRPS